MSEKTVYPGAPVNNVNYSQNFHQSSPFKPEQNEGTNYPGGNVNPSSEQVNKKPILGFFIFSIKGLCWRVLAIVSRSKYYW